MDSNKSIDGLKTRRAKTSASSKLKSKKTTTVATAKPTRSAKSTVSKTAALKTSSHTRTTNPAPQKQLRSAPHKSTPLKAALSRSKSTKPTALNPSVTSPRSIVRQTTTQSDNYSSSQDRSPQSASTPNYNSSATEDFLKPTQIFNFDEQSGELKNPDTSPSIIKKSQTKQKKVKHPVSKKRKIAKHIIIVILLLLLLGIIWLALWGNDIIAKITGGHGGIFDLLTLAEPSYAPLKTDANGRTNILAFGTSGYNMEGDEGNGTHDGAQLTDSIMVISFNQDTKDVVMLSLPRDLKASPTCTATGKINEIYWCNGGGKNDLQSEAEAASALMDEAGNILGIDFQYYAHLNWGSLVQIVDTLGGITVTLDEDINDYYYTGIVFKADTPYTISGIEAVALARARHGTASGDFSRGASQQKILIGIKEKMLEKQLSLVDIINLANALGDNLRTNFSLEEIKSLAHQISEFNFDSIRQLSLIEPETLVTTGTINNISYVLPVGGVGYYTRIQKYITEMLSNNPSVYENATILILNGTNTAGLASAEKEALEEDGYINLTIDDAPEGIYETKYTLYTRDQSTPNTKKSLEEKYSITSQPFDQLPSNIPQDYNFILILGDSSHESE